MLPNQKWTCTYTQWSTFHTCPYQFRALYLDKSAKRQTSEALDKGIRIHSGIEAYLQNQTDDLPVEVHNSWAPRLKKIRKDGKVLVEYRAENDVAWGKIDALEPTVIHDWKSGKCRKHDLDKREQLRFYRWLIKDDLPISCRLEWVEHPMQKSTLEVELYWTPQLDRIWRDRITQVWAGVYPQTPGWYCRFCPVTDCPENTSGENP